MMKSVKRLSLLVALILCVTVGGVYATWNYAGNDVADITHLQTAVMADPVIEGSSGAYTVDTSGLQMIIDQKADGDYDAVLNITGSIKITFTVNTNATNEIKEKGLTTYVSFSNPTSPDMYEGKEIFTCSTNKITINPVGGSGTVWSADGSNFTCEIPASAVEPLITLGDFNLDTKAKYDVFNNALTGVNLHISDGVTTTAQSE